MDATPVFMAWYSLSLESEQTVTPSEARGL
jgi:hypothetical protein